jgi:4-oxalocrotonate tautomerase
MPILRLEMLAGRTPEQIAELADVLTRETARIAKCPEADIQIVFDEVARSNWAVGGKIVAPRAATS